MNAQLAIRTAKALRKALPVPDEHSEQVAFVNWFHIQFPRVLIFAIPNGAHIAGNARQRAIKIARMKAEGLVPGVPDLHVPEWRVWIEMKRTQGGRLSPDQIKQIGYLRGIRDVVIVAKGWQDAKAQLLLALDKEVRT